MLKELEHIRRVAEVSETLRRAALESAAKVQRATKQGVSRKMRDDLAQAMAQTETQLREYEKNSTAVGYATYNPMAFITSCDQQVGMDNLIKPSDVGNSDTFTTLMEEVSSIRKRKQYIHVKETPVGNSVEESLKLLDKAKTILGETALDSSTWGNLPTDLLQMTVETVDMPRVNDEVGEFQEQLKRMAFNVEEIAEQQQQAIMDGDMKLSETLYFKKITTQEAMVDVFNKLFTTLDAYHSEHFVQPLKKVHQVHSAANTKISNLMKDQETLKLAVEADLKKLNDMSKDVSEQENTAGKQFKQMLEENDRQLEENRVQQEQVVAAIEELERHLVTLGDDRTQIIHRRLENTDAHKKRDADVGNFRRFYKDHKVLLETTIQNCEAAEEITDAVDEMICNGCNAIEQFMRTVDENVEKERVTAHELRLTHFRDLYLTLGDLQYKKERNLEELDKKIAHTQIQQEMAMETFNPKAKEFANMKKDLLDVRDEMESQVQVLHDKGQLHIEAFKPTEVALVEAGKDFLHPVQELETLNKNRQQKLLEYHNLMKSEDDPEAAEMTAEEELRRIEEERRSIQPRRPVSESRRTRPDMPMVSEPYTGSPTKSSNGSSPVKATNNNGID